jgi:L(+)-tartrate dehydratase beta subunit
MEELLTEGLNELGLGPQGLTGNNSVMGVNIESSARHPSTIGVAVNRPAAGRTVAARSGSTPTCLTKSFRTKESSCEKNSHHPDQGRRPRIAEYRRRGVPDRPLVTCRDVAHRRLIEQGRELPGGPRRRRHFPRRPDRPQKDDGEYEMVSIGPTTSMRMEKFEKEFIKQTGVKLIVGKGGMGAGNAGRLRREQGGARHFPRRAALCWRRPRSKNRRRRVEGPGYARDTVDQPGQGIRPADHLDRHQGQEPDRGEQGVFNEKKKPILERINSRSASSNINDYLKRCRHSLRMQGATLPLHMPRGRHGGTTC